MKIFQRRYATLWNNVSWKVKMNKKTILILGMILSLCIFQTACGRKGPPQPPLEQVSAPAFKSF